MSSLFSFVGKHIGFSHQACEIPLISYCHVWLPKRILPLSSQISPTFSGFVLKWPTVHREMCRASPSKWVFCCPKPVQSQKKTMRGFSLNGFTKIAIYILPKLGFPKIRCRQVGTPWAGRRGRRAPAACWLQASWSSGRVAWLWP